MATEQTTLTPPNVRECVFRSHALGREMHYRAVLPADYDNDPSKHFPVLHLLHGLYGDWTNWTTLTQLPRYAERLPLIIVTPDAGNYWYVNSATDPQNRFEDYIWSDFIPEVEHRFRTIRDRKARIIAGLSMGGYGAVKFALKHPDFFAIAASFSGTFDAALGLHIERPEFAPYLLAAFGPEGSQTRRDNDVFALSQGIGPSSAPYLYLSCGESDELLESNRRFAATLAERGFRHEYHEQPGAHDWIYWDKQVKKLLSCDLIKTLSRLRLS